MNIQYRQPNSECDLVYMEYAFDEDRTEAANVAGANSFELQQSIHMLRHSFPEGPTWTPERMEINGRKGRRAICVLAQDALRYRVFDLDSTSNDEDVMDVTND